MGKLNFSIHPLFFVFGLYFALIGKVFSFLCFTLCAVVHELGHAIAAEKLGYKLFKVVLMPYGAIISGDIEGLKAKDEMSIVLAGPLLNILIATFLVALWWLFPECYPFTQLAVEANLSLALVNLIPAYPLDGGRFLYAILSTKLSAKTSLKICRGVGLAFCCLLLCLFIYSCFVGINISILFFTIFLLFGVFNRDRQNSYVKIYEGLSMSALDKTREVKTLALSSNATLKALYKRINGDFLYRIYLFSERGEIVKILEPNEVVCLMEERSLYEKIIS